MSKNTVIPKAACAILLASLLVSSCGSAPAEAPSAATTEAPDQQSAANAETAASTTTFCRRSFLTETHFISEHLICAIMIA